jgi:hypothetical protein
MEMDGDWVALLPQWPADTHDCIFLGRALKQLEGISASPEEARNRMISAIDRGELSLRGRIVFEKEARFCQVESSARAPEGWGECLMYFCIVERDKRPWIPAARRRAMPQPHWLFVTRQSLDTFLAAHLTEQTAPEGRYPKDRALIAKGVSLISEGKALNPLQAARAVAPFAEGSSVDQAVERLRKKIGAVVKSGAEKSAIAKDRQ